MLQERVDSNIPYGVIGNCQILALVSNEASIDWACFPRFDSPSVFAKILDEKKGGSFSIRPETSKYSCQQEYIRNTNVLVTDFECFEETNGTYQGRFQVIDFAPRFFQHERSFKPQSIFRIVRLLDGAPRIIVDCDPQFDYATREAEIKTGSNHIRYDDNLRLTTSAPLTYIQEKRAFKLEEDEYFALTYSNPLEANLKFTAEEFLERTISYWHTWVKRSNIAREYQDDVIRAALILKLHYYNDTGAIIAASTTSIPEADKSVRNWDYRFCWLRDAFFVIKALDSLGHFTEKERFVSYLSNLIHSSLGGELQPVYGISGEKDLIEKELDHLSGFRGNKPVRIGNAAYTHKQFDIYGEMALSLEPIFFDRRLISYKLDQLFVDFRYLVEKSIELFMQPDASIWEFRSDNDIHTFSQIFCWAAVDRGVGVAKEMNEPELADEWRKKADEMKEIILKESWCEEEQMFTQKFGGCSADASNLLMHELGIIEANDPRFVSTVKRYGEILRKDDYMYRYVTEDDFGFPETSFTICTFWYISALIAIGEVDEAQRLYENLLNHRNHLGLLSEDIHPQTGELWGNFPQTYSLVGIIMIAKQLEAALTERASSMTGAKPREHVA